MLYLRLSLHHGTYPHPCSPLLQLPTVGLLRLSKRSFTNFTDADFCIRTMSSIVTISSCQSRYMYCLLGSMPSNCPPSISSCPITNRHDRFYSVFFAPANPPGVHFETPKEIVFAAINNFTPAQLRSSSYRVGPAGICSSKRQPFILNYTVPCMTYLRGVFTRCRNMAKIATIRST